MYSNGNIIILGISHAVTKKLRDRIIDVNNYHYMILLYSVIDKL